MQLGDKRPRSAVSRVSAACLVSGETLSTQIKGIWKEHACDVVVLKKPGNLDRLLELTESNMKKMYEQCPGWGWSLDKKRQEFLHPDSRFIVCSYPNGDLMGFVHFRFEVSDQHEQEHPEIYLWEIQLASQSRGQGVGSKLMQSVQVLAKLHCMKQVTLTVFEGKSKSTTEILILDRK